MSGRLYGIGLGPGDPELLTLKALRLIGTCPVIAFPYRLGNETSLARQIAEPHLPGNQIEIAFPVPMESDRAPARAAYDQAAARIAAELDRGHDVALLCVGDPFFYGSFMYLHARLAASYSTEIVPGVTSISAASAVAALPLASRQDVLTVIPATLPDDDIRARLAGADAAAIIKLGRHFDRVRALIETMGLATRAILVAKAGLPDARTVRLSALPADSAPYFALLLIERAGDIL